MKTYSSRPRDITRKWYILDASQAPLGRLSTVAASLLMGKGKPQFTSHIDGGDNVIVINAAKLVVTGNKLQKKIYYSHSGYPGGLRQKRLEEMVKSSPEEVIRHAIRGMLPDNKLRSPRLNRLKIYADSEHKHVGQNPETVSLKRSK